MSNKKTNVTFDEDTGEITVNGRSTSPYGYSNGRSVYVDEKGEFILKIDDRGYTHDDAGIYAGISQEDRKYFVPVIAQGYTDEGFRWSLQPFIELDWNQTREAERIIDDLVDEYDLIDMHVDNWAMHNGQPIIFDYGMI